MRFIKGMSFLELVYPPGIKMHHQHVALILLSLRIRIILHLLIKVIRNFPRIHHNSILIVTLLLQIFFHRRKYLLKVLD